MRDWFRRPWLTLPSLFAAERAADALLGWSAAGAVMLGIAATLIADAQGGEWWVILLCGLASAAFFGALQVRLVRGMRADEERAREEMINAAVARTLSVMYDAIRDVTGDGPRRPA